MSADAEDFLSDAERKLFAKLASRFVDNKTKRWKGIRGPKWSTDTDALIYIDDERCDTAYGQGADEVLAQHLSEDEQSVLMKHGYLVKDEKVFAFSRFLMEKFILSTVLLNAATAERKQISEAIAMLGHTPGQTFDNDLGSSPALT